ncbi:MAG: glycosyltransferase family 39 protein [Deltaproteobacteria bacterium]|nr:glycosyltransferase family 39 protein [Deltaproteobacteria bacterium]
MKLPRGGLPKCLLGLLAISAVLKVLVWGVVVTQDPARFVYTDSVAYHETTRSLLQAGRFSVSADRPNVPETRRTPGYPIFLAPAYALAGERPAAGIAWQILLSLATILLLFRLTQERFSTPVGIAAAGLLTLDAASFSHSLLLLTETLFAFLMVAMLFCALRFAKGNRGVLWAGGIGLLLAVATLVRPISYYLAPAVAGWILVAAWRRHLSPQKTCAALLAFLIPVVGLLGGWQLRNYRLTGSGDISQIVGLDLLFFRGAKVISLRDGISLEEARHQLGKGWYRELHPETRDFTEEELTERWKEEGLAILAQHPAEVAKMQLVGMAATLGGTGEHTVMRLLGIPIPSSGPLGDLFRLKPRDYLRRWVLERSMSFLVALVLLAFLAVLYWGGARWWWTSLRHRRVEVFDLCAWGVAAYLVLISAGPESYHRFRVPITPILCLYAAAGLETSRRRLFRLAAHGDDRESMPR